TFVWLAVGRLVQQKDYPTLLRAVRLLRDEDFVVLVAGNGPLAGELQEECCRLGLQGRVRFLGAQENILNLYSAADAFVMSSEFEGLSAALLEASSMALPSVVTNVGGNSEVVVQDETGFVVEPGSPERLAEAMRQVLRAPAEQRISWGSEARRYCVRNFEFQ